MATFGHGPNPYIEKENNMSEQIYEASVYARTVKYTNFKGKEQTVELYFALDPLQLMSLVAGFKPKAAKKSGNPARANDTSAITDEESIKFVRDLAQKSAGFPSDDGESFEPFVEFSDSLAGKAFLTKLAASDVDRQEFAEKVILNPFRAFVGFALAEEGNTEKEKQEFRAMLSQLENVFTVKPRSGESLEERKARLAAELASIDMTDES